MRLSLFYAHTDVEFLTFHLSFPLHLVLRCLLVCYPLLFPYFTVADRAALLQLWHRCLQAMFSIKKLILMTTNPPKSLPLVRYV